MKYQPPVDGDVDDPYITGDEATGTEGSPVPGEAIEHTQREVLAVIEGYGLTPDEADLAQMFKAIQKGIDDISTAVNDITGLQISNNSTDAEHDIDIAPGRARSADNTATLTLTATLTKQIDAAWTAGDDAGGMFTGSVAADTTYHVFLIRKDSDGSIDAGIDVSATAANAPAGYTAYRRVGSVLTDASGNIMPFKIVGDFVRWTAPTQDVNASLGLTPTSYAIKTPLGLKLPAVIAFSGDQGTSGTLFGWVYSPDDSDPSTPSSSDHNYATSGDAGTTSNHMMVQTNASSQVRAVYSTAARPIYITTLGWIDRRDV